MKNSILLSGRYSRAAVLTVVALAVASCSDDGGTGTNPVATVDKTGSTDNQIATAGVALPVSPEVTILKANGEKAVGETVTFAVQSGGGSVVDGVQLTDVRGVARPTEWILGGVAGPNTMTATVGGLSVSFTAHGAAGPAANLLLIAGHEQTAPVFTEVPIDPEVKVADAFGNGVVGVTVDWQITDGNGTVIGASSILSIRDGQVKIEGWQLGPFPGSNSLQASVSGLGSVTFDATGT